METAFTIDQLVLSSVGYFFYLMGRHLYKSNPGPTPKPGQTIDASWSIGSVVVTRALHVRVCRSFHETKEILNAMQLFL